MGIGALMYNIVLAFLGFSDYTWMLGIVLFFFGSSRNLMNLSMNAQAIGVQALYNRSIMSSFHAVWSMAGFAGAAFGYLMVTLNILPAWHLLGVSLVLSALTLYYYKDALDQQPDHKNKRSIFSLPPKGMLIFSLICFTSMACENTMQNTKVVKSDMYGGIKYVQAGVTHLMKRQREGWAYIRP